MVDVPINPAVIKWAREERRLSPADAARRLKITEARLAEIEASDSVPLPLLRKMAKKYEISFGTLLMPEPLPTMTRPKIEDFRTHGGLPAEMDHKLIVELENVNEQLDTMAELKEVVPELFAAPPLTHATRAGSAERLAEGERQRLGIDPLVQLGWEGASEGFKRWRAAIEGKGIFVYLLNLGPDTNCRGFSLLGERDIPVIAINNDERDAAARTFTLMHEYGHLLIRETGLSDQRGHPVERFCNQFAAFLLMPRQQFLAEAKLLNPQNGPWTDALMGKLAERFKVSRTAVAIHLEDAALAPVGFYAAKEAEWNKPKKKKKGGPPTPYEEKRVNRWGARHVDLVFNALDRGHINQLDAYELLGVRPKYFNALRREVREQQAAYGGAR